MMKKWVFVVSLIALLMSCRKEPISWDVDTLFPILHTRITLQQAIPDDMLSVINGNELQLEYQGNLISLTLDSNLNVPDTTISDTFNLPFGNITFQPGQTFLEDSNFTRYDFGNAQLTHLNILSGQMVISVSSELTGPSVLEYALPTMTKNGVPFFIKENVPASINGTPTIVNKTIDLAGYQISLTGLQNDDFNVLASTYRAYIDSSSAPVPVTSGQNFIANNSLSGIIPSYLRGSFGSETTQVQESNIEIDAFSNIKGGQISLDQASLVFEIKNEAGIDASIDVNLIKGTNTYNQTEVSLNSPLSNGTINLNRATETNGIFSSPYATAYSKSLNASNSNVSEFIANLPNELSYDFAIDLNPLGNVSNSNDFLYGNTGIEINLDAKIPLNFNASNLLFSDTSDFEIDSTSQEDANQIIDGYLNVYNTNWFPFDLELQFYLMNENLVIIDSIFSTPQVVSGAAATFGVVDFPMESMMKAPLSPSRIEHLYQTTSIQTLLKINSTDTGNIKILDSYFIDSKIVGDFTYQIEIE